MASSSHQLNEEGNAFSGIEPPGKRRRVCESSRLYDVFINHRGHVKQTLATPLYNSLEQLGLRTFLDSQEKELGTSFPSTIETAISSAKVHIAIFSKGYAESAWCLAELVLMLQSNAKIIPLFYQVKPSDLRRIEKGAYAEAFIKYEEKGRYLEKLNEWKEALQSLSFIAGQEFESFGDTECQNIVAAVQKEVQRKTRLLHVADHPVGLNNLVEDFEKRCLDDLVQDFENQCRLEEGEHKSKVVGIFGMGGVGKTTLAKELFNRMKMNYSRASFLFDVREASMRSQLPSLQDQLVKDLFREDLNFRNIEEDLNFRNIEEGTSHLKYHIGGNPFLSFLIVVDDIDHVEQLNALRVMDILDKFCNSLVIVTTRDHGVLITAGITVGYNLRGMDFNYGRELFCWHAFSQSHPRSGYEQLVDSFVEFCDGLPLSLQVLGRHVHGRNVDYWNLELIKVSKMLPRDVKQRLKISFDALDAEEKQIFMDIACFFIDKSKSMAEIVWGGSGWNAHHALVTLKDKCLVEEIKIWVSNEIKFCVSNKEAIGLRMHDHLKDLGRELALELSPPHRLWRPQDLKSLESEGFKTILAKNNVRCFHSIFKGSWASWVIFSVGQSDICFETSAYFLWFEGSEYFQEQTSIPSWIPLQNLHYLNIRGGQLETLWENNVQGPSQLKTLHISRTVLKELPSLSGLNCLEKIKIDSCEKLQNITLPTTLIMLTLRNCKHLQRIVATGDLTKLRELIIEECPKLEDLPSLSTGSCLQEIEIDSCEKLQNITLPTTLIKLTVRNCSYLQKVAATGDLTKLRELIIEVCPELEDLPSLSTAQEIEIVYCEKLQNITLPTTLIKLTVRRCSYLQKVAATGDLTKLRELIIEGCPELEDLPSLSTGQEIEIICCRKLQNITLPTTFIKLTVQSCWHLQRIAATCDLTKPRELFIEQCPELEDLPSLSTGSCLQELNILSCRKLQNITLPTTLIKLIVQSCWHLQRIAATGDLTKLRELIIIECPELEDLPSLSTGSCLQEIEIDNCEKLQNITLPTTLIKLTVRSCSYLQKVAATGDLTKLRELFIERCPELEDLPSLSTGRCLQELYIFSCGKLQNITLPTTLIKLTVLRCNHLQRIAATGDLTKLRKLIIRRCPKLEELPSLSRISWLESIEISMCEKLENIAGIEELHALEDMKLHCCSNAVTRNCILKLKSVPLDTFVVGRAVDGAESILNEYLFSEADIGAVEVTQIPSFFSQQDFPKMSESSAVIVCMLIVFDDTTLNQSFYNVTDNGLYVHEGEWIMTIIKCEGWSWPPESILYELGLGLFLESPTPQIMKKGFEMELKKDEEWKRVGVLRTIIDRLHHL